MQNHQELLEERDRAIIKTLQAWNEFPGRSSSELAWNEWMAKQTEAINGLINLYQALPEKSQ